MVALLDLNSFIYMLIAESLVLSEEILESRRSRISKIKRLRRAVDMKRTHTYCSIISKVKVPRYIHKRMELTCERLMHLTWFARIADPD